ncbi:MAG: hypothetical protein ACOCUV_01860 [bacterium]
MSRKPLMQSYAIRRAETAQEEVENFAKPHILSMKSNSYKMKERLKSGMIKFE